MGLCERRSGHGQAAEEASTVGTADACVRSEMAWFLYCTAEYENAAQAAQDNG